MSDLPIFVFGTLCHDRLRDIVLGDRADVTVTRAYLPGFRTHWVKGQDYPTLVAEQGGEAEGLILDGLDDTHRARLDFFEGGFGYDLIEVEVSVDGAPRRALRFRPDHDAAPGSPWRLSDWADLNAPIWIAAAEEAMGYFGRITAADLAQRMGMIRLRASARVRAHASTPATLRADMTVEDDVTVLDARQPYIDYFAVAEADLRFRRFDGTMSEPVSRAGFRMGDAVTVLPYDPVADTVLLVEQFRMGPYLRGDPKPWLLEPIAGRVDPGEAVETTARREALEEANLRVSELHFVSGHYPSPGAVTEFIYAYVALADLTAKDGTVAGLASEAEDIRSHVIAFDHFMRLVETGEVAAGPLVTSAYWLALNRARLRGEA
ncbi:MAG: gamma-glutamylcyclotransferase [Pseudomonadota bacterium]|nr:gamma-glutamylcyclotransferase [Pseudomonadota bacterium]